MIRPSFPRVDILFFTRKSIATMILFCLLNLKCIEFDRTRRPNHILSRDTFLEPDPSPRATAETIVVLEGWWLFTDSRRKLEIELWIVWSQHIVTDHTNYECRNVFLRIKCDNYIRWYDFYIRLSLKKKTFGPMYAY